MRRAPAVGGALPLPEDLWEVLGLTYDSCVTIGVEFGPGSTLFDPNFPELEFIAGGPIDGKAGWFAGWDMTILPTPFERDFNARLLDVVFAQWHALGVPFSSALDPEPTEVIDPGALLWCSLEFLPTEPRLRESVLG